MRAGRMVSTARSVARSSAVLRNLRLQAFRLQRAALSQLSKTVSVDERTVIFEAYSGRSYACSPKALYKEMQEDPRFTDHTFVWALREPERHRWLEDRDDTGRTKLVRWKSPEYYRAYFSAYLWVTNSLLPLALPKKPEQFMVQTWHGSPLKRLRTDIVPNTQSANAAHTEVVRKNTLDVSRWDMLLSPSPFASQAFTSAFDLERLGKQEILVECGYPRNTSLFRINAGRVREIRKKLGLPKGKKVILYTPTWRDHQYDPATGYVFTPELDFERLRSLLGEEYVLLYRGHYHVGEVDLSPWEGFVFDVSRFRNINSIFAISDLLITDYSSTFFDFSLLDRPVMFYMYDADFYAHDLRGFYLDTDELPGEVARTEDELREMLGDIEGYAERTADRRAPFRSRFAPQDSFSAPNTALNLISERLRAHR